MPEDILWPFTPNEDRRHEEYEWNTQVLSLRKGEQRIAMREYPRFSMSHTFDLLKPQTAAAREFATWAMKLNNGLLHPVWSEKFDAVIEEHTVGTPERLFIKGDSRFSRISPQDHILLWFSPEDMEIVQVYRQTWMGVSLMMEDSNLDWIGRSCVAVPLVAGRPDKNFSINYSDRIRHTVTVPMVSREFRSGRLPISVYLALDVSGSMAGTPLEIAKQAITLALRDILNLVESTMIDFRIMVNAWATASNVNSVIPARTREEINELIEWVNGLSTAGGTNIHAAVLPAADYFDDSNRQNIMITITDTNTFTGLEDAIEVVSPWIDPNTAPNAYGRGNAVRMYAVGVNIGGSTSNLQNFDNQQGGQIPNITLTDPSALVRVLRSAIFGEHSPLVAYPSLINSDDPEAPILDRNNMVITSTREIVGRKRVVFDSAQGPDAWWDQEIYNDDSVVLSLDLFGPAERYAALAWLHSLKGQQREFYMPSLNRDYRMFQDQEVEFPEQLYVYSAGLDNPARLAGARLRIERRNGQVEYVTIIGGGVATEGVFQLQVDPPLSPLLTRSEALQISRLFRYRSSTDAIRVVYDNLWQSRISVTCKRMNDDDFVEHDWNVEPEVIE